MSKLQILADLLGAAGDEGVDIVRALMRRADEPDLPPTDWRGSHSAPVDLEYNAPMHDMTRMYPDDFYTSQGRRYYGTSDPEMDASTFDLIHSVRGQPDAPVSVYRAVPADAPDEILPGDWVTPNLEYARSHGEILGDAPGSFKILQGEAPARKLLTEGNSPHEFGYIGKLAGAALLGGAVMPEEAEAAGLSSAARAFAKYVSRRTWKNEQEAREALKDTINNYINTPASSWLTPIDPAVVNELSFVRHGNGVKVSQKGMGQKRKPIVMHDEPGDYPAPVDWYASDLQDIRKEGFDVSEGYIDIDDLPKARLAGGETAYDWSELAMGGEPPPIQISLNKNGTVSVLDGNHRLHWYREQGYDTVPVRYVDKRTEKSKAAATSAGLLSAALLGGAAFEEAEAGPLTAGARRIIDSRFLQPLGGGNPRIQIAERVETLPVDVTHRQMDMGGRYTLEDFEGRPYILTQSDRSAAGGDITAVGGKQIYPVSLRGGRDFMFDPESGGMVWASYPKVVEGIWRRAHDLQRATGQDPILLPYSMAPTGIDFATMPLDVMVGYARAGMSKKNKAKLNTYIKKRIPDWTGVDDPESIALFRTVTGDTRKAIADFIDKNLRDVPGGMSISEARAATSDTAQYLSPDGRVRNIGEIDTTASLVDDSGHPTYIGGLPGEGVGTLRDDVDVRQMMAGKGRELTGDSSDIRALSMNPELSTGVIDEDMLRRIYGQSERGSASPEMLSALAATTAAVSSFTELRENKRSFWQERKQELLDMVSNPLLFNSALGVKPIVGGSLGEFIDEGVSNAGQTIANSWQRLVDSPLFDTLEAPLRGYYAMSEIPAALAMGQDGDEALRRAAVTAGEPVEETAFRMSSEGVTKPMIGTPLEPIAPYAGAVTGAALQVGGGL